MQENHDHKIVKEILFSYESNNKPVDQQVKFWMISQ